MISKLNLLQVAAVLALIATPTVSLSTMIDALGLAHTHEYFQMAEPDVVEREKQELHARGWAKNFGWTYPPPPPPKGGSKASRRP